MAGVEGEGTGDGGFAVWKRRQSRDGGGERGKEDGSMVGGNRDLD